MTIENILKDINISIPMIKILDNFFKKENLEIKIDIFSEKRNKFFKLKNENPNVEFAVLDLIAFYSAIKSFYDLKTQATKKNKILSTNELKKYDNFLCWVRTNKRFLLQREVRGPWDFSTGNSGNICAKLRIFKI